MAKPRINSDDRDPNFVRYFSGLIKERGYSDIRQEVTDSGSSATAIAGELEITVTTNGSNALTLLWNMVKSRNIPDRD